MLYGIDWGAVIGTNIAQNHSDNVLGFLINMPMVAPPRPTFHNILFHPIKVFLFLLSTIVGLITVYGDDTTTLAKFMFENVEKCEDAAYCAIQCAPPYILAYGLSDSPVGLLGWILDPYHACTFHASDADTTSFRILSLLMNS